MKKNITIDKNTFCTLADYIMVVAVAEKEKELYSIYSVDRRRSEAHDVLCELFEIEREKTLQITNNLNDYIVLDYDLLMTSNSFMSKQVNKLYTALILIKKEKRQ